MYYNFFVKPMRQHGAGMPVFVGARMQLEKMFDTIEVNLMMDTGMPVPFIDGKSHVVLELKIGLLDGAL